METVNIPTQLLARAKDAAQVRSKRGVVKLALEEFIARHPAPYQPSAALTKKILAQRNGKSGRSFNNSREANAAIARGEL